MANSKGPENIAQGHPYDFHVSGPRNFTSPNWKDLIHSTWKDANYKRMVMACFVQAAYLLELDRQEKRTESDSLAPKWWKPFKYKLTQTLVDHRDGSIYGAILEWDRAAALPDLLPLRPSGAPKAVVALRGTLLKSPTIRRDVGDDLRFFVSESLKGSVRFTGAQVALESAVNRFGSANVCIVGHSLGAGFALQVGKALAKKNVFVECHLFNPPSVSLTMSLRILGEKAGSFWKGIRAGKDKNNEVVIVKEESNNVGDGVMKSLGERAGSLWREFRAGKDKNNEVLIVKEEPNVAGDGAVGSLDEKAGSLWNGITVRKDKNNEVLIIKEESNNVGDGVVRSLGEKAGSFWKEIRAGRDKNNEVLIVKEEQNGEKAGSLLNEIREEKDKNEEILIAKEEPNIVGDGALRSLSEKAGSLWKEISAGKDKNVDILIAEEESSDIVRDKGKRVHKEAERWVPNLYVNTSDYICCYYNDDVGDDSAANANKVKISSGNVDVAAKILVASKGPKKFLEAHGLQQWWAEDMELQLALNQSKLITRQLRSLYEMPIPKH